MTKEQIYLFLSSLAATIHFGMVLLYLACTFLIWFSESEPIRFGAALFLCSVWIQQKIFKGCFSTQLEGYFLKKGGKERDDVFFFNRFTRGFLKKKFYLSVVQVEALFQGMLLFFFVLSAFLIISYFL